MLTSLENASVGVSTQMGANVANAIGAGLNALTNVHDNDHTTTRSTVGSNITLDVGDGNIPTALSRDASNSNQQVKQFDKQDYQERAEMAQVISAVSDNTITLTLKPKLDDAEKVLNNDKATEAEKAQARQVVETYGKGSDLQLAIRAVTAAAQGLATGSAASAAVGGASPFLNKAIKQATTDENGQVNQSANLLVHAVLGAAEALATGNNALAGAAGAATGEVAAKLITEQLYNTTPDKLSEAQKDTVSALSQLASGLSGVLAGDNTGSGITAAKSGKSAVENNALWL
ncbi:VENN motif pre-toxin domain-containing protein [Pasteurellaceae bacterium TAE3-ERU1]|nr:VENN motif pre-toxin domain-containing protein [Pasteurellaceae bacterium TAE3-ERU1]